MGTKTIMYDRIVPPGGEFRPRTRVRVRLVAADTGEGTGYNSTDQRTIIGVADELLTDSELFVIDLDATASISAPENAAYEITRVYPKSPAPPAETFTVPAEPTPTTTTQAVTLPAANVAASTTGFASSGAIYLAGQLVTYTGSTPTAFTGCTGGTGLIASGTAVRQAHWIPDHLVNPPVGLPNLHVDDAIGAHAASAVAVAPTGGLVATDAQAALAELDSDLAAEAALARNADNLTSGTVADARIAASIARDSEVTAAVAAEAALRETGDTTRSANQQVANYTLVLSDAGKAVEGNAAGALNFTVPPNSSVAYPTGTIIEVVQVGAGAVSLVQGSGVTITGDTVTPGTGGSLLLRKTGTNAWFSAIASVRSGTFAGTQGGVPATALDTSATAQTKAGGVTFAGDVVFGSGHPSLWVPFTNDPATDTAAIQAGLNTLRDKPGTFLELVPQKVYELTSTLTLATDAYKDITVRMNGATLKAGAALPLHMLEIGGTSAPGGTIKFSGGVIDMNSGGRATGQKQGIRLNRGNVVEFELMRFANMIHHFVEVRDTYEGDFISALCDYAGSGTEANNSHWYINSPNANVVLLGGSFKDIGAAADTNQALYVNQCKSLTGGLTRFQNVAQGVDLRALAKGVNWGYGARFVGGEAGSIGALGHAVRLSGIDQRIAGVTVEDWMNTAAVFRTMSGSERCVFDSTQIRPHPSAPPATQSCIRVAGSRHRILNPDWVGMQTGTSSVINLLDSPTDCELVGGVLEYGPAIFRIATAQVAEAIRVRGTDTRNHTAVWINTANAVGSTPTVQVAEMAASIYRETFTASNVTTDRTFNADATTVEELADVLGTLIADLRAKRLVA